MFSNFKDTFIRKPLYTAAPPKAVMDLINKDLPEGFTYVYEHDGMCRLDAPDGFNIESGKVRLSAEAKKVLPDNPTIKELELYSYNSQSDIVFTADDDGYFRINGERIQASDIIKAPMKNLQFQNLQFFMKPSPFPEPFNIMVGGNGYKMQVLMQRVANNSLYTQRYESAGNESIGLSYDIDLQNDKFTLNISLNIGNATEVYDVVVANSIYNAFMDGKGILAGRAFKTNPQISEKKVSEDTVRFWEKLYEVEQILKVSFNILNGITVDDVRCVEKIYRCLIEKKPYKTYKVYNSVKGTGNLEQFTENENDEREVYFEFVADGHFELLGQKIIFKGIFGIFGASVKEKIISQSSNPREFEIFLKTAEGKKMYESVQLFLSEAELEEFRANKDHIKRLEKAEEIISLE